MPLSIKPFHLAPWNVHIVYPNCQKNINTKSLRKNSIGGSLQSSDLNQKKEAPFCTFLPGSYTLEAAVVLPVALTFFTFILFLLRIAVVQVGIQRSLDYVATNAALVWKTKECSLAELVILSNAKIVSMNIPTDYITGNMLGIDYTNSSVSDQYINLNAEYDIHFPIEILGSYDFHMAQGVSKRKWIGWDPEEENGDGSYVYVTKEGSVYHCRYDCTYLHPSIHTVNASDVKSAKNTENKRYAPCAACKSKKKKTGIFYVTDYGETYHSSITCIGLKRTIYRKKLEAVVGLGGCIKCAGGK